MLVGLAFLFLAVVAVAVSLSAWQDYRRALEVGLDPFWLLVAFWLLVSFTVLLVFFGLYSFAKARSVR